MQPSTRAALTVPLRRTALTVAAVLSWVGCAAAAPQCTDTKLYEPYTIKIFNNTNESGAGYNIFPVIATPTNDADEWLQGAFNVPKTEIATLTYGHEYVYRIYVNPQTGIAPGESVIVTLPLCSQLVQNPTGKVKDEYINWWNGGRVHIYDSPVGQPPPASFIEAWDADQDNSVSPLTAGPSCDGCSVATPIYRSKTALPANDPDQLTEYTLSGVDKTGDFYKLIPNLFDYDISYVDHVRTPVAMGPVGNPDIGYIGTILPIDEFRDIMQDFLTSYFGWPRYLDPITQEPYLRIPGTYNAFAQWNPLQQTIIEKPGRAIDRLGEQWTNCLKATGTQEICKSIRTVNQFFLRNYDNYVKLTKRGECNPPDPLPNKPTLNSLLTHVYGWVPYNEHCKGGAAANDLSLDPQFRQVHKTYVALQYLPPLGTFNPYVNLVHGTDYLNMPGSYAFSIDDDVGNMLVNGQGIILAVGGNTGLENDVQYDKRDIVHVNIGDPKPLKRPNWAQFGFCDGVPKRDVKDLSIQITSVVYPCTFALTDTAGRKYQFALNKPPFPARQSNLPISDCSAPGTWCKSVSAYTEQLPEVKNYVIVEAPVPQTGPAAKR